MNLHQGDQPVDLGIGGHQLGQDAAKAQRVLAERRSRPVIAASRGVALIEDEVEHLEDRGEARDQLRASRCLEGHVGGNQRPFRPDDSLTNCRLGDQERASDLRRTEPSEQPQRQRDPRLRRQYRVTAGEDQPQQIVANVIIDHDIERVDRGLLLRLELAVELLVFAFDPRVASQKIDRAPFRRGHEPRAGIPRNARLGPLLERRHQGVLGEVFGRSDIPHDPCQAGNHGGRLDAPDRVDDAVGFRGRHGDAPGSR